MFFSIFPKFKTTFRNFFSIFQTFLYFFIIAPYSLTRPTFSVIFWVFSNFIQFSLFYQIVQFSHKCKKKLTFFRHLFCFICFTIFIVPYFSTHSTNFRNFANYLLTSFQIFPNTLALFSFFVIFFIVFQKVFLAYGHC